MSGCMSSSLAVSHIWLSVYHTFAADFFRSARFLRSSSWNFGVKDSGLMARWWINEWYFVT